MLFRAITQKPVFALGVVLLMAPSVAQAALDIPLTVTLSENITVTGVPQIPVDVGGVTRYATYTAGTGTNTLTFTLTPQLGDLDLDGITVASPINLNGGTLKDAAGNNATLTFTPPNTSGIKVNYPSLGMDFTYDADGRYTLNGTAYNDLASLLSAAGGTFTRPSIGTYFDSTGTLQTATSDVPRFDHDPITHARKGILLEEGRTNLRSYASDFSNAVWTKSGITVVADNYTAPDGTLTADKLTPTVGTGLHRVYEAATNTTVTLGQAYTASVFVRSAGQQYLDLYLGYTNFPSNNGATFDIINGTITRTFTSTTPTIQSIGNGWYRCSISVTATASGSTNSAFYIVHSTNSGSANISTTADGTAAYHVWGAQYEQGTYPTSYIPTTTAAVARSTDTLSTPTGTWYNQSAGSFYNKFSWETSTGSGYPMFFRMDDTTNNNRWNLYYKQSTNTLALDSYNGGITDFYYGISSSISGSAKVAGAQALNSMNSAFNGSTKTLDTTNTPAVVTRLILTGSVANKWHDVLRYYPARVADAQLALITQ